MKKVLQLFAILIAVGAISQSIKAYTTEDEEIISEEVENKIIQLIEIRRAIKAEGEESVLNHPDIRAAFPGIKTSKDLNNNLAEYINHYLNKIKSENGIKILNPKKKGNLNSHPDEPGV